MAYSPQITVTPKLLRALEEIAVLRERIQSAVVQVAWVPALQKETQVRNTHSSTAIEGNPLTLEQVRELAEGREIPAATERSKREILNYFAGLRFIAKNAKQSALTHDSILKLHSIVAANVMDQGKVGKYRNIMVRIGKHLPPPPEQVSALMRELLEWWNKAAPEWSPVISSAAIHYQFEHIHPFADGNGRTGRMLALWELYRRGFDTHHIFSVDEFYGSDRTRYYESLRAVQSNDGQLSPWLEYCADGLKSTLEKVWIRIQHFTAKQGKTKLVLRPKQEQLLQLLRNRGSMSPQEVWTALGISKQGAAKVIAPLLEAKVIQRTGGKKTGGYVLKSR